MGNHRTPFWRNLSVRGCGYLTGLVLLCLWGMYWRTGELPSRGLEYDEIWTLENYALAVTPDAIFTDLATPNNHPLHSWLMRSAIQIFGVSHVSLRLPAWLAGTAILFLMIWTVGRLFRDRLTVFIALAFTACSGLLIHYTETARGYSLQAALILAFLGATARRDFFRTQTVLRCLVFIIIIPFAAILTLPTSLVFLFPVCALEVWNLGRNWYPFRGRQNRRVRMDIPLQLAAYLILLALALLWLWHGWDQFQTGKANFGDRIRSFAVWWHFARVTLRGLTAWPVLALAALGIVVAPTWRLRVLLAGFLIFPLFMAPMTRAGPVRAYLPLLLILIPAAAWGWRWLWRYTPAAFRTWAAAGLAAVLLGLTPTSRTAWTPVDWLQLYPAVEKATDDGAFLCYPATSGYEIRFYFPEVAVVNNIRRIPQIPGRFIQVGRSDAISGIDPATGGEKRVSFPAGITPEITLIQGTTLAVYRLRPLVADTISTGHPPVIMAAIPPESPETVRAWQNRLREASGSSDWILLNPFFRGQVTRSGENTVREGRILVSGAPGLNLANLKELEARSGGKFRLFQIAAGKEP